VLYDAKDSAVYTYQKGHHQIPQVGVGRGGVVMGAVVVVEMVPDAGCRQPESRTAA
jgi:hypothetical protein